MTVVSPTGPMPVPAGPSPAVKYPFVSSGGERDDLVLRTYQRSPSPGRPAACSLVIDMGIRGVAFQCLPQHRCHRPILLARGPACGPAGPGKFPVSAGCRPAELLPMAAWTLSPRAKMVFQRHVSPAQVPVLNNTAFDLMTRSGFTARAPAEPDHWTIHRDARWIGKSARPLRTAARPTTTTAPTLGPGHGVDAVPRPLRGRGTHRSETSTAPALGPGHEVETVPGAVPGHRQAEKRLRPGC